MADLRPRWELLCDSLEAPAAKPVYDALASRYSEPWRHYHTLEHIEDCLNWLDWFFEGPRATEAAGLELAVWFHDVIYNPGQSTNEQDSAAWFRAQLGDQPTLQPLCSEVEHLILLTKHHDPTACRGVFDSVLLDIDLAGLGAEPEQFWKNDRAIRREYETVFSPEQVRAGRLAFMRGVLERKRLFNNHLFYTRLEAQARQNIRHLVASLEDA